MIMLRWCAVEECNVGLASNEGVVPEAAQAVQSKTLGCG